MKKQRIKETKLGELEYTIKLKYSRGTNSLLYVISHRLDIQHFIKAEVQRPPFYSMVGADGLSSWLIFRSHRYFPGIAQSSTNIE